MSIKATDFMAAMGVETFIIDGNGMRKVEPSMTEEEAIKKLYEEE